MFSEMVQKTVPPRNTPVVFPISRRYAVLTVEIVVSVFVSLRAACAEWRCP